jgi:hypothetical protein
MLNMFYLERNLETTIMAVYGDFYSEKMYVVCDPGGTFELKCDINSEAGADVIITYKNNIVTAIKKGEERTFCGIILYMTYATDPKLPENYYYELHPKSHQLGQINLPPNSKLLMPMTMNKVFNPKKSVMLRYRKGPCDNYYEVQ